MNILTAWNRIKRFILRGLWGLELAGLPRARKFAFQAMRTLTLAVHGFVADKCALRAGGLTLVFIFSMAPALAVGFSVAKGFGVQEKIQPAVYSQLGLVDKMGNIKPEAEELGKWLGQIMDYVQNTRIEALGIAGTLLMLFAAYKVLSSIEKTMNDIWGVRRKRKLMRKAVDYVAVLVVSPIMLIITALLTASVHIRSILDIIGLGAHPLLVRLAGLFVSFLFAAIGLWFLYFFFPNTRVRLTSAATGAVVAAILWMGLQSAHMGLQIGVRKYNAIYGAFAAFPIFVLWLNMAWQVVLFGAELSYAHANHRDIEFGGLSFTPSPAYREQIALGVMTLAARSFVHETPPPTCEEMAQRLATPIRLMRKLAGQLTSAGLLVEIQADRPQFHPAAPLDHITVGRVLRAVREQGDDSPQTTRMLEKLGVADLLEQRKQASRSFHNITLAELAQAGNKPADNT